MWGFPLQPSGEKQTDKVALHECANGWMDIHSCLDLLIYHMVGVKGLYGLLNRKLHPLMDDSHYLVLR